MYLHLIIFLLFHELHKVGFLLDIQNIGLSKRKVGYLLDLRNGGQSKFDIQILEKLIKKYTAFCTYVMHSQKTKCSIRMWIWTFFLILDIRYLPFNDNRCDWGCGRTSSDRGRWEQMEVRHGKYTERNSLNCSDRWGCGLQQFVAPGVVTTINEEDLYLYLSVCHSDDWPHVCHSLVPS